MPFSINNDLQRLTAHTTTPETPAQQREKLKKATQAFEGVFVGQLLKQMRQSLQNSNALFGNSSEAKMYQEMMDEQTAERISQTGAFGVAKTLYSRLERLLPKEERVQGSGNGVQGHNTDLTPSPLPKREGELSQQGFSPNPSLPNLKGRVPK